MSDSTPSTSTVTTAPPERTLGDEFAQLGTTTSTRGWVALAAVTILVIGFLVWGVFGTISVQTTLPASIVNGSLPALVASPKDGFLVGGADIGATIKAGDAVAVIRPYDGGPDVSATAPFDFAPATYVVLPGSPVKQGDILARGSALAPDGAPSQNIAAIAYVTLDQIAMLEGAVGMTVTNTAPGAGGAPVAVKLRSVDSQPSTELRVAEVTGNAYYARDVYETSGGAPYMAVFEYADAGQDVSDDPGGQTGVLTITEWSDAPLQVLFGR
ncbi:MAG: hypothetical protein RL347_1143 [Actinomycetota bacterium]|jgi:hypothetical protein